MGNSSKLRTMAGLEYHFLLRELSSLCGKFISKFYELEGGLFRLRFGSSDLLVQLGVRMHLTKYISPSPQTPSNFCEFVRKRLEGKKLTSLSQHGMDRIIFAKFASPSEECTLVFEMFAGGNLLVLDASGAIMRPYKKEEWKGRRLARGEKYSTPPSLQLPFPPSAQELSALFSQSEKEKFIVSVLSQLSIGTSYINEALLACDIAPKTPAHSLSPSQLSALSSEFSRMHSSLSPIMYKQDGKPIDFSVFPLSQYSGLEAVQRPSLSAAADEFYASVPSPIPASSAHEKKKEQLQLRLSLQLASLEEAQKQAQECTQAGNAIMQNSQMLQSLSLEINSMRAKKIGWEEIAALLKKKKIEMEKTGSVVYVDL